MSKREQESTPGPSKNTRTRASNREGKGKNDKASQFFEEPKKLRGFAKHAVLKSYLDAWFPIMSFNPSRGPPKQLVYVDGFAGPGKYEYEDESDKNEMDNKEPEKEQLGSPVLVYKALAEHGNLRDRDATITLIFFEAKKDLYLRLEKNIEEAKKMYPIQHEVEIETEVHHGDFNKLMDDVLDRFPESAMFVFADPFGHNMKMSTLQNILATHNPTSPRELFLNLMDGRLRSFINDKSKHKNQDEFLGVGDSDDPEDDWREKCKNATPDEKLSIISEFYIRRLQEGQANRLFVLKFAMKNQRNHHAYHLVYVTCHIKGLQKMKLKMSKRSQDSKSFVFSEWVAEKTGRSVRDIKFDKDEISQDLTKRLIEQFSLPDQENEVYGREIEDFVWLDTPYPFNVKNELKKAMKGAGIKFTTCREKFEVKKFTFPKKPDISSSLDNQMTKEVNLNGIKNDDPAASSSGNEPPSKKKRKNK